LTLYDGAHNPSGIAALAAALPDVLDGRRPVVVVSVLDDKDAAAMLRGLLPHPAGAVVTRRSPPPPRRGPPPPPRRSARPPAAAGGARPSPPRTARCSAPGSWRAPAGRW